MAVSIDTVDVQDKKAQLNEKLEQIRRPGLQSQKQAALILSAVEATLKDQKSDPTPTAYFAALLSLLNQYVGNGSSDKKDLAAAVIYLLDLTTPCVPKSILRSKFSAILTTLQPALASGSADAPFLRSAIGCLVSLLIVQDGQGWALPQSQTSPRKATANLLALSLDSRPKVRKRAQDGLYRVLTHAPPSPSVDHPAADMCAETALRNFESLATSTGSSKKQRAEDGATSSNEAAVIHAMQLVKTIASACGGWPTRSLESLCDVLFSVAKSRSEFLTTAAFDVFEAIFSGMAKQQAFDKLPRLLVAIQDLQPSQNDSQLLPPWLAVVSRAYDVASQFEPEETFQKLPETFSMISNFLAASAHNIRISSSECLISLLVNCVPASVVLEPSIYDEKVLEKLAGTITSLLSVKYQASWMEVFNVIGAAFDNFKWRAEGLLSNAVQAIGDLRAQKNFSGQPQADEVLSKAIAGMGPAAVLKILPLNLVSPVAGQPGRAWLVPLLRDSVTNTTLAHFRTELVPLSEKLFEKVASKASDQKTMETKIFETLIQQIWSTLTGYCDRPLDITSAFDQSFAELLCKVLYQQPEMRLTICRALQALVDSNKLIAEFDGEEDLILQGRISKADAAANLTHLATFAPNLLAVLFNVYGETSTQRRGPVLECIDSYLSIASPHELSETFDRVAAMLDTSIKEQPDQVKPQKQAKAADDKPPMSYALMDIIVTAAVYLPRDSFHALFNIASTVISQQKEAQLQKKAYKLIPRLAQSETGAIALQERAAEVRQMLIANGSHVTVPARKDRLHALSQIVEMLSPDDLSFIPAILPEIILATKENAERARTSAFDLLVLMGEKMAAGGTLLVPQEAGEPKAVPATLDEYLTMLSAGLAGTSPHMISASVTALSRVLFTFHASISSSSLLDLLSTMDLFLKSPAREIVRSVLGFIKVCVIVLPTTTMSPRLPNLVPALMTWSHEQKAHFRVKVKSILDRMLRKFGAETIERFCPPEDRKLITNIRKRRERNKRKKVATPGDEEDEEAEAGAEEGKQKFESGFDEAIYGSDESDSEASEGEAASRRAQRDRGRSAGKNARREGDAYIHEDEDEPLDLLDRKSLANISSTRPVKQRAGAGAGVEKRKAKTDLDGKLVLKDDDEMGRDEDAGEEMVDVDESGGLEKGINAYVDAIRGRDAAKRGQRGRLKFSNKRERPGDGDEDDGAEGAAAGGERGRFHGARGSGRGDRGGRGGRGGRAGRGSIGGRGDFKSERRGLGVDKRRGGVGVVKSPRGGGVRRR